MADPWLLATARELTDPSAPKVVALELRGADASQARLREEVFPSGSLSGRILEVGCGTGVVLRDLMLRNPGIEVAVGVDPSPGAIEKARALEKETRAGGTNPCKVEWMTGDSDNLGAVVDRLDIMLKDGGTEEAIGKPLFDHVIFWTTMSHIDPTPASDGVSARDRALLNAMKVLKKPGGRLHIIDNDSVGRELRSSNADSAKNDPLANEYISHLTRIYEHSVCKLEISDEERKRLGMHCMRMIPQTLQLICDRHNASCSSASERIHLRNALPVKEGSEGKETSDAPTVKLVPIRYGGKLENGDDDYAFNNLRRVLDGSVAAGHLTEPQRAELMADAEGRRARDEFEMVFSYGHCHVEIY